MTASAAEWSERLREAEAQGRSYKEVAAEHGVAATTVHYWLKRKRRDEKAAQSKARSESAAGFVKVERKAPVAPSHGVVVECGSVRIRVETLADVPLASAILRAMGAHL